MLRYLLPAMALVLSGRAARAQVASSMDSAPDTSSAEARSVAPGASVAPIVLAGLPRVAHHGAHSMETLPASARGAANDGLALPGDTLTPHPKHRHIALGMVIGTVAGAGIGYGLAKASCRDGGDGGDGPPCELGVGLATVWCAIIGFAAGGVIGALADREHPSAPLHHLALGAIPLGDRGMALSLSLR